MRELVRKYLIAAKMISTYTGASVEEISNALDVTKRSVFNVINVLEDVGFAIYRVPDPENPKRFRYKSYNSVENLFTIR